MKVSRSFRHAAQTSDVTSLSDAHQNAFNVLSMTDKEKGDTGRLIVDHLEQKKYQFVMLRYICSLSRKPLCVDGASDVRRYFLLFDPDQRIMDQQIITKEELDACILNCRDSNKILLTFSRLHGYLTATEQPFYLTKCIITATYRPAPVPWYWHWAPITADPEDVIDLRLVYNVTGAYADRILTQLKVRLEHERKANETNAHERDTLSSSSSPTSATAVPPTGLVRIEPTGVAIVRTRPNSGVFVLGPGNNTKEEDSSSSDSLVSTED